MSLLLNLIISFPLLLTSVSVYYLLHQMIATPIHITGPHLSVPSLVLTDHKGVSMLGTDAQGRVQGMDVTGKDMDWLADTQVGQHVLK